MENNFDNCFHGVYYRVFTNSSVRIEDNTFTNMSTWSSSFFPQLNRAIRMDNIATFANVEILDNHIELPERGIQAIGIVNDGLTIADNNIEYPSTFTNSNIPTLPFIGKFYRGISVEGCTGATVEDNDVKRAGNNHNTGLADVQDHFRGIFIANSPDINVLRNDIRAFGAAMYIDGSSPNSTFNCNKYERSYTGMDYNNATIGDQGGFMQPNGNRWMQNVGQNRMTGNTVLISPQAQWWHRSNGPTNPFPFEFGVTFGIEFEPTNGLAGCPLILINWPPFPFAVESNIREERFGQIVRNERQFNDYDDAHRWRETQYAHRHFRTNNDWLNMGEDDDSDYQDFYNDVLQSCTGMLEETRISIDSCNFDNAANYLAQATANDLREDNLREVYNIYLNTYADSIFEFTEDEYLTLYDIACQYALDGGEGVYVARTLLGEDLDCEGVRPKSLSLEDEDNHNFKEENSYKVYPNPSQGELFVETDYDSGVIVIMDVSGKQVMSTQINSTLETIHVDDLNNGIYFIQIQNNNEIIFNEKIVVAK